MNHEAEKDGIAEFIKKNQGEVIAICNTAGITVGRMYDVLRALSEEFAETSKRIEETLKPLQDNPPEDIPWLKKQIKHCKNPLEEKALRKRLNEATRNRRRRNNSGGR